MPIRMTGINSGMDTESIITELVKAKSAKKEKLIKAQTKLQWKQDAWKELNSKIYGLYTKTFSNMRLKSDYMKKVTKLSDESYASVVTGGSAVDGVQDLEISSLAKSGYLTGGKISASGQSVSSSTTMAELGAQDGNITVTLGDGTTKEIEIKTTDKISDVVKKFQDAGLNASFDTTNQRFFISSKESGAAANFELSDGTNGTGPLSNLGLDYNNPPTGTNIEDQIPHKIKGEDAVIKLNGATFKSKTNTFSINGLTITANKVTAAGEKITLTTTQDTDGIYDMIKNFFKEYNAIINEMDSLYNAPSSKGYEPLTDDERDALSDKEIEKWEEKIKKSILRKDDTVNEVAQAMKTIMVSGIKVGTDENDPAAGKMMYLSDFGINTLGYFTAPENEKNAYHIDGDPDDVNTVNNEDRLRAAIATNPDQVVDFFSKLSESLYNKIGDMMKKTDYSSSFTLYDDVLMKREYEEYKKDIADEEEKIKSYEDRWYDKFSAMETALAQLQSKESAVAGLFQ